MPKTLGDSRWALSLELLGGVEAQERAGLYASLPLLCRDESRQLLMRSLLLRGSLALPSVLALERPSSTVEPRELPDRSSVRWLVLPELRAPSTTAKPGGFLTDLLTSGGFSQRR